MAERERLTNKERRAQAREERKRKEAEQAAKRKRAQVRNGLITAVIVTVIAAVALQAFLGGPSTIDDQILVSADAAEDAREAAGCEILVEREPLEDRSHFEGAPPPADQVYTGIRPTHSGPHSPSVVGISTYSRQADEVVSTHNLEHGAVIVWWDESADNGAIESWADTMNASGFQGPAMSGVGIITSPWTDPGFEDDTTVAFRAWGTAMNCQEWDETVANEFVARNFTTRGIGPERFFFDYPDHVLDVEGLEIEDVSPEDAPTDETHTPDAELEGDDATTEDAEDAEGGADDAGDDADGGDDADDGDDG